MTSSAARRALWLLSAVYLLYVAALTLTPVSVNPFVRANPYLRGNIVPFHTILKVVGDDRAPSAISDLVGNTLMLAPLAVLLVLANAGRWPVTRVVLAVLAVTVGIEFAQLTVVPGRVGDVDDIILNMVGGVIGVAVGRAVLRSRSGRALAADSPGQPASSVSASRSSTLS